MNKRCFFSSGKADLKCPCKLLLLRCRTTPQVSDQCYIYMPKGTRVLHLAVRWPESTRNAALDDTGGAHQDQVDTAGHQTETSHHLQDWNSRDREESKEAIYRTRRHRNWRQKTYEAADDQERVGHQQSEDDVWSRNNFTSSKRI